MWILVVLLILITPVALAVWLVASHINLGRRVSDQQRIIEFLEQRVRILENRTDLADGRSRTAVTTAPAAVAPSPPVAPPQPTAPPQQPAAPRYPVSPGAAAPAAAGSAAANAQPPHAPQMAPHTPSPKITMPSGGALFAFAGGLFVLIGALTFLGMAISRGWISHGQQVALGMLAGVAVYAIGIVTSRRSARTGPANVAGLVTIGTGVAIVVFSAITGVVIYDVLDAVLGLLIVVAAAAAAVAAALRYDSRPLAAFGVVGALASPVLVDAPTTTVTLLVLAIALVASVAICVRRDWSWLALTALIVTAPQLAQWAQIWSYIDDQLFTPHPIAQVSIVLISWWALMVAAAFGFDFVRNGEHPRGSSTALVFLASSITAGIAVVTEQGMRHDSDAAAVWLACFGGVHVLAAVIAIATKRRPARHVALMLAAVGSGVLAWSAGLALGGPGQGAFWSIEAAVLIAVHRITGDRRVFVAGALGAVLAVGNAFTADVGVQVIVDDENFTVHQLPALIAFGAPLLAAVAIRVLALRPATDVHAAAIDSQEDIAAVADAVAILVGVVGAATLVHPWLDDLGTVLVFIAGALIGSVLSLARPSAPRVLATGMATAGAIVSTVGTVAQPEGLWFGVSSTVDLIVAGAAWIAALAALVMHPRVREVAHLRAALLAALAAAVWYFASMLIVTLMVTNPSMNDTTGTTRAQLTLSTAWAIAGLAAIVIGLRRRIAIVHRVGAALLALAAVKVLVIDSQYFSAGARVGAFIAVGALMLVGGWLYVQAQRPADDGEPPAP